MQKYHKLQQIRIWMYITDHSTKTVVRKTQAEGRSQEQALPPITPSVLTNVEKAVWD